MMLHFNWAYPCILQKNTLKLPIATIKGNDAVHLITV